MTVLLARTTITGHYHFDGMLNVERLNDCHGACSNPRTARSSAGSDQAELIAHEIRPSEKSARHCTPMHAIQAPVRTVACSAVYFAKKLCSRTAVHATARRTLHSRLPPALTSNQDGSLNGIGVQCRAAPCNGVQCRAVPCSTSDTAALARPAHRPRARVPLLPALAPRASRLPPRAPACPRSSRAHPSRPSRTLPHALANAPSRTSPCCTSEPAVLLGPGLPFLVRTLVVLL